MNTSESKMQVYKLQELWISLRIRLMAIVLITYYFVPHDRNTITCDAFYTGLVIPSLPPSGCGFPGVYMS